MSTRRNSIPPHATITEVQSSEFLYSVMIYSFRILQCIVYQQNKIGVCASLFFAAQSMLENYTNLCITNWEMKLTRAARHFLWCLWLSCFAWREKSILFCIASYLWMWWVKKREVCHSSTCWLQLQLFQITWAGGTKQLNNLISTFPTRHTIQWSSLSLKHSEKSKIWAIRTGKYCKNLQACYTTVNKKETLQ